MERASTEAVLPVLDGPCGLFCGAQNAGTHVYSMSRPCRQTSQQTCASVARLRTEEDAVVVAFAWRGRVTISPAEAGPGGVHVGMVELTKAPKVL
jgi:hypothetical protein